MFSCSDSCFVDATLLEERSIFIKRMTWRYLGNISNINSSNNSNSRRHIVMSAVRLLLKKIASRQMACIGISCLRNSTPFRVAVRGVAEPVINNNCSYIMR